ncbi:MAG: DUF6265 family protein [Sphingomicrobium sp.]
MLASFLISAAAAAQTPALPAFMTGCWELIDGDHWTHECWMEPKAGLMLGASREGTGAKLSSWEQLRIEQGTDGTITLFASPGGRSALPFAGRAVTAKAIEFTNATHDYPQRIRYELKGGRLLTEISLIDGDKAVRWAYSPERH